MVEEAWCFCDPSPGEDDGGLRAERAGTMTQPTNPSTRGTEVAGGASGPSNSASGTTLGVTEKESYTERHSRAVTTVGGERMRTQGLYTPLLEHLTD